MVRAPGLECLQRSPIARLGRSLGVQLVGRHPPAGVFGQKMQCGVRGQRAFDGQTTTGMCGCRDVAGLALRGCSHVCTDISELAGPGVSTESGDVPVALRGVDQFVVVVPADAGGEVRHDPLPKFPERLVSDLNAAPFPLPTANPVPTYAPEPTSSTSVAGEETGRRGTLPAVGIETSTAGAECAPASPHSG